MAEKPKAKVTAVERQKLALHVALIQQRSGLSKADATFVAWRDGPKGLESLLAQITEGGTK